MKTPVVKSNNPSELQLVIKQLTREINALEDRIKLIKTKTEQSLTNGTSSSVSSDATLQGPAGPQGPQGIPGPSGNDGSFEAHTHPEFYDVTALDLWLSNKTADSIQEGDTNKYYTDAKVSTVINTLWISLVTGYSTEPTLNSTIATGDVYNYTFTTGVGTVTYYRLVPSGSADDAFYTTFSGGALSGLISKKPITV